MKFHPTFSLLLSTLFIGGMSTAQAAISLDRTRIVYDSSEKSVSVNIANENKQLPYLAQSWLENEQGEKVKQGALAIIPPVQRLEPSAKGMVRIMQTPSAASLPQDRESLFYFNLREIPPKSEKANVLQIALQTRLKVFYRPAGLKSESNSVWQDQLVLHTVAGGYRIENPTPYYITVVGLAGSKEASSKGKFESVMVAPKQSETVKMAPVSTPYLTYINDYGGQPTLAFTCAAARCVAKKA
ncbi:fimbria/pilus periplasmic chaperone [Serratia marcescens]|nr:fimbria/pilus periplasmic chaperone [Serratia marcescens]